LSYRFIKIHRKFTSAYLLCDKASLRGDIDAIRQVETPFFKKADHRPLKNEPLSQEMHLMMALLSRGLKLSNS
jgi:hypothetical protein